MINNRNLQSSLLSVLLVVLGMNFSAMAQGYDPSLSIQGLNKQSNHSVISTALGGTIFSKTNDVGLLFANPAGLRGISKPVLSIGTHNYNVSSEQVQQYAPAKYQPLWSLFMEGLTDYVPALDTAILDSAANKMPRPYDKLTPGWKSSKTKNLPVQFSAAYPFSLFGVNFVAAAGSGQFANLNHFYQNNNVMSPAINNQRPSPIIYLTGSATLPVEWYQSVTVRDGNINRYGGALSVSLDENFAFGVSGSILSGSSDDYERKTGRGQMVYYASYFKVDSVDYSYVTSGTSDYSGSEFVLSANYQTPTFSFGLAIKPPFTVTRKINAIAKKDSSGQHTENAINGEEIIAFPLSGTVGLSLQLKKYLRATLEYEYLPYSEVSYENITGEETKPWRDASILRAGIEYTPINWLSFQFGVREQNEVFEPIGNPIEGEPVSASTYSAGFRLNWQGISLNTAYEYSKLSYTDMLENTVYINKSTLQNIKMEIQYELPLMH